MEQSSLESLDDLLLNVNNSVHIHTLCPISVLPIQYKGKFPKEYGTKDLFPALKVPTTIC